MNNPAVRHWGKVKRARNLAAKKLRSDPQFRMKVRENKKRKAEQKKYRAMKDPSGDYDNLDEWILNNGQES